MTKVAFVTGCSSGFGEAIALHLATVGYAVIATMRRPEAASAALHESGIRIVELDITDQSSRERAIATATSEFGRLDLLVNNAGIALRGSVEETPDAQLRSVMETNFYGPVALIQLALPIMRSQRSGRIVNVTAIGALLCSPFLSSYCASKHAIDAVTAALDVEVRSLGIRASSVLPGQFKTAIGTNMTHISVGPSYEEVSDHLGKQYQKRAGEAEADLKPIVDAVIAAATAPEPKQRYLVGKGSALLLPPVIQNLEDIHRIELERAQIA